MKYIVVLGDGMSDEPVAELGGKLDASGWYWLLLLILGVEVGSDRRIVESLPTLGLEAAAIAVVSLLGSCLLAWLLWTVVRCKENAGYGGNSQTKSVQWTGVRRKGNAGKKEGRG